MGVNFFPQWALLGPVNDSKSPIRGGTWIAYTWSVGKESCVLCSSKNKVEKHC
jgi:hypothetical protein